MSKRLFGVVAGITALVVCGASFGDISGTGGKSKWSFFSFLISDAPVDGAEAVVVTVNGIQLLSRSGGVALTHTVNPPLQIDLLQLQGKNVATLIDHVATQPGVYKQLRLLLDTPSEDCRNVVAPFASYIAIDGTQYPLVVPSGATTGLLINGDIQLIADQASTYVLDFDLRRAVAQRGTSGCYNLRPAGRIVDVASAGSIAGEVDAHLFENTQCRVDRATGHGAAVYVFEGRDQRPSDISGRATGPLTTANVTVRESAAGYAFEVGYLPQGAYTLALTCQAAADDPDKVDRIAFLAGLNAVVNANADTVVRFDAVSEAGSPRR